MIYVYNSTMAVLCAVGVWRITIHLPSPQNSNVRTSCKISFCTYFLIGSHNMRITWGIAVTPTFDSVNVLAEVLVGQVLSEWLTPVHVPGLNPCDFYLWNIMNVNNP